MAYPLLSIKALEATDMKFTPGPWKYFDVHGDKWVFNISASLPGFTNEVPAQVSGSSAIEAEANARLIAAAPELLEALQFVMRVNPGAVYINGVDGEMYSEWDIAKRVIAKATGESK